MVCLSVRLSVCPSVRLSACLPVCLCLTLYVCPSVRPSGVCLTLVPSQSRFRQVTLTCTQSGLPFYGQNPHGYSNASQHQSSESLGQSREFETTYDSFARADQMKLRASLNNTNPCKRPVRCRHKGEDASETLDGSAASPRYPAVFAWSPCLYRPAWRLVILPGVCRKGRNGGRKNAF